MPTENQPADPFGPNGRTLHIQLSVRGALRDFNKRQLIGMFHMKGGRECTAGEAKDHLLEALAQGKEVLPFGSPCAGFDFAENCCLGHDKPTPVVNAHDLVSMKIADERVMRYDLDRATDKACTEMVPADGGQYVESNDFDVSPPSVPPLQLRLDSADQRTDVFPLQ
ncbi:hypothetical protein [Pseudomonas rustica]|uniref:hypothetical protein n=1 Tax=Pseudomonas rustica TaxID=2827099 RepID=UPI00201619DA|nr:hypothetical protein [Pseudomonas rustica]